MYVCHLVFRAHRGAPSRLINYQKKVVAVQQPPLVNFKSHTQCVSMYLGRKYLVRTMFLHSLLGTGPGFIMGRGHTSGPPEVG